MGLGSACSVFPSSKSNCRDEIGSASLCLSQISSTGEEIQGKQFMGSPPFLGSFPLHLSHPSP